MENGRGLKTSIMPVVTLTFLFVGLRITLAATNCPYLYFYNGTACSPCSECPPGFGLKASCSEKEDTKCEACYPQYDYSNTTSMEECIMCDKYSNCLPGNARVVKNCTIFSPTVCDGCAEGSFFDPNLGMNGGCTECSAPCGVFEVETRACKTEHDRKCTPGRQKKKEIPTLISSQPSSAAVPSVGSEGAADDDDDNDDGAVSPTPDLTKEEPIYEKIWFWLVISSVVLITTVTTAAVRYRIRRGRGTTDRINTTSGNEIIRQQMSPLMPRDDLNLPIKYLTIEQKRYIANMLNDKDSYGFFYWERTAEKVGLGAESRAWKGLDNPTESFLRSYGEKAGSTVTTLIEALREDGLTHFADQIEIAFSSTSQDHGETERVAETPV